MSVESAPEDKPSGPEPPPSDDVLVEAQFVEDLARSLTSSLADAEDLRQEVWLATLSSSPKRLGSLRPWLATVARRIRLNHWRGNSARLAREALYARERPDAHGGTAASSVPPATVARLARALDQLPAASRELLTLRYGLNLSFAEIGQRLGIPKRTARTRHFRLIDRIREQIVDGEGADEPPIGHVQRAAARTIGPPCTPMKNSRRSGVVARRTFGPT